MRRIRRSGTEYCVQDKERWVSNNQFMRTTWNRNGWVLCHVHSYRSYKTFKINKNENSCDYRLFHLLVKLLQSWSL